MTPYRPCAIAALLLTFAPAASPAQADGTPPPAVVTAELPPAPLTIDGAPVPWTEFSAWLVLLQGPANLEDFAFDWLLQREAQAVGLPIDEAELRARIEANVETRVRNTFDGDRSRWLAELESAGQSVETFFASRLLEERRQALVDGLTRLRRVVKEEDVRQRWEATYGLGGRRLRVSRLFLEVITPEQTPGTTRDENIEAGNRARAAVRVEAEALVTRLAEGADFGALVREHSDDAATRDSGGTLEQPLEPKDWPGLNTDAIEGLETGEVCTPFYSRGGYNLLKVDSVELTPFETVAVQLERELAAEPASISETLELREDLMASAPLERLPELTREVEVDAARLKRPVLTLANTPVSRAEFSRWLMQERGLPLLRTFMQHRAMATRAAAAGLEPTSLEIEQRVQEDLEHQIGAFFQGKREKWLADVAAKGQSVEDFLHIARIRTRHNMRAERLFLAQREVTEAMLRQAWTDRYGEGGHSLDVRNLVRHLPTPDADQFESEEELRAWIDEQTSEILAFLGRLRQRALDGEDFDALVRTHSEDSASRDRGGRSEGRFELHQWPEDLQQELRALPAGGVAEPRQFGTTFVLFEVAGRVHVPFEEVEAELRKSLETARPSQVEVASFINGETSQVVVAPTATYFD